jgi:hypothetical protein
MTFFFALDLVGRECRTHHDVGQQVDGKRQMLVEDLDVVARVLLRGKGIELATDRVNGLGDVLGAAVVGAFEEHMLDKVRNAAALVAFMPRTAHQPHANRHRPHMRHRFGDQAKPIVENVTNDHAMNFRRLTHGRCELRSSG